MVALAILSYVNSILQKCHLSVSAQNIKLQTTEMQQEYNSNAIDIQAKCSRNTTEINRSTTEMQQTHNRNTAKVQDNCNRIATEIQQIYNRNAAETQ